MQNTRSTTTTMSTNQTYPVPKINKRIRRVKRMDGDKYTFCYHCHSWKKKGNCNTCRRRKYQDPYDLFWDGPNYNNDRRLSKNIHRLTQVRRLYQALNHAWICNINTMLRYARNHDGANNLCIIVFRNTHLRHLILQIVYHMISNIYRPTATYFAVRYSYNLHQPRAPPPPPLLWP